MDGERTDRHREGASGAGFLNVVKFNDVAVNFNAGPRAESYLICGELAYSILR
jgi:hypothetical protein